MAKYKVCFAVLAFLCVADAGLWAQKTRHYYVQAEDVIWDFAPSNQNLVHGGAIPEPWTNSHVFPMVRYIQMLDSELGNGTKVPLGSRTKSSVKECNYDSNPEHNKDHRKNQ